MSEFLRNTGNDYYKEASQLLLTANSGERELIKNIEDKLTRAHKFYLDASSKANCDSEKCKCTKNIGATFLRFYQVSVLKRECTGQAHILKKVVVYYERAMCQGDCQSQSWRKDVEEKMLYACVLLLHVQFDMMEIHKTIQDLIKAHPHRSSLYNAMLNYKWAERFFKKAVLALEADDFKNAKDNFGKSYKPLEEGKNFSNRCKHFQKEFDSLEDSICEEQKRADAKHLVFIADDLLEKAVFYSEELNMDAIWEAIDNYLRASTIFPSDVELYAMVKSKVGKIYYKLLKMRTRAKEYIMETINLTSTLPAAGRVKKTNWYREAEKILEEIQAAEIKETSTYIQAERQEVLSSMKSDTDAIDARTEEVNNSMENVYLVSPSERNVAKQKFISSAGSYLKWLFNNFPPTAGKIPTVPDGDCEWIIMKKVFIKAISCYHPDKYNKETQKQEYYRSEYIVKNLNRIYETFKG